MAFHSAWKTFKAHFGSSLKNLKRYRDLLSDDKITATIIEVKSLRQSMEEKLDELSRKVEGLHIVDHETEALRHRELVDKKRQVVLSKLDAPDYRYDFEKACKERRGTSSGDWILGHPAFQEWAKMDTSDPRTLYLHGIPGTG